ALFNFRFALSKSQIALFSDALVLLLFSFFVDFDILFKASASFFVSFCIFSLSESISPSRRFIWLVTNDIDIQSPHFCMSCRFNYKTLNIRSQWKSGNLINLIEVSSETEYSG